MAKNLLFILIFLLSQSNIFAQWDLNSGIPNPSIKLDWPLFDFPYQIDAMHTVGHGFFGSYANPSMAQSLAVTSNLFSGFHFGMKYFYDNANFNDRWKRSIYHLGVVLGNFFFLYIPGGEGWLHEEYHRAVMTRFRVNSFNDMNLFPLGAELVYVSRVTDEDLIRFKQESPSDFVRLHAAGIEGQYLMIDSLQRNNFFYNQNLLNEYLYWLSTVNSHAYIWVSVSPSEIDETLERIDSRETDIASRDFTGFDFNAWVYDLFRPDEPYEARGVHPTGIGIRRYRSTQDLTEAELAYLRKQRYLHFFNYVSPMWFGIRSIRIGDTGFYGNFAMRHYLTSFGTNISANVFLKRAQYNMVFTFHNYQNYQHYFPGIEAEFIDYPLSIGKHELLLSPRILLGMQPLDQNFRTNMPEFLGLFGLRVDYRANNNIFPYIDFTAKTNGWIAGNEYLNANTSIRLGVSLRF